MDMAEIDGAVAPDRRELEAIGEALFRAGTAFDGFTAQMRRAFDMNAHERLAIAALWARGPMTMTELGAWIPLSRAAVTTLVDRLENNGLVSRGSDAADRRRTVVQITQAAIDRMVPVLEPWGEDVGKMIAAMGHERWQVVREFMAEYSALNDRHAERLKQMGDEEIRALARP